MIEIHIKYMSLYEILEHKEYLHELLSFYLCKSHKNAGVYVLYLKERYGLDYGVMFVWFGCLSNCLQGDHKQDS